MKRLIISMLFSLIVGIFNFMLDGKINHVFAGFCFGIVTTIVVSIWAEI